MSKILVVDDLRDSADSLALLFDALGHTTMTSYDGRQAVDAAKAFAPDIVFLDINMPILDGVSVVTALRAMDNDVPVCVLSARSSVDDRVAGLEAGADDYLVKPFVLAEQALARGLSTTQALDLAGFGTDRQWRRARARQRSAAPVLSGDAG